MAGFTDTTTATAVKLPLYILAGDTDLPLPVSAKFFVPFPGKIRHLYNLNIHRSGVSLFDKFFYYGFSSFSVGQKWTKMLS